MTSKNASKPYNALSGVDRMQATPRNMLLGYAADFVNKLGQYANAEDPTMPMGKANPVLSILSETMGVPATARVLDRLSYGEPITNYGKANVPLIPADTAAAAGNMLSVAGLAAKAAPVVGSMARTAAANAQMPNTVPRAAQRGAIVYHGTPHKFDKFDSSKIGTGEGAQAYGHGLYLAENQNIARGYQEKLSDAVYKMDGAPMAGNSDPVIVATQIQQMGGAKAAKEYFLKEADRAARLAAESGSKKMAASAENFNKWASLVDDVAERNFAIEQGGHLYSVDLPDDQIAKMLDWDNGGKEIWQSAVSQHGSPSRAADALRSQGIPGIRYLDGGSRGAGEGTKNFVVFPGNEDMLKILERNGKAIK